MFIFSLNRLQLHKDNSDGEFEAGPQRDSILMGYLRAVLPFSSFSSWSPVSGITSSCSTIVASSWFDENSKQNETEGYSGMF